MKEKLMRKIVIEWWTEKVLGKKDSIPRIRGLESIVDEGTDYVTVGKSRWGEPRVKRKK